MVLNPRNFDCPETGAPCIDGRCKRTFCVALKEQADALAAQAEAEIAEYRKESEKVIRLWCELKKRPMLTGPQLERAVRDPAVLREAKRRVAELRKLIP
jgi:hypothetical protein